MTLFVILSFILIPIAILFLGLQLIALGDWFKAKFEVPFSITFDFSRYLEYKPYLYLILVIIVFTLLSFAYSTFWSPRAKERYRTKRLSKEENISNHTTMKNLLYLSMEDAETNSKLHIFENYKQMLIYLAEIIDNELKLNNGKYDGYFLSYEDLLKLGITEYFPQINNKVSFVTGLFKNKS